MLPISRILAPVDFSERSLGMVPYIKALASRYNSEVILLHVVNPFYALPATAVSGPVMIPVPESVLAERQKHLDGFAVSELQEVRVRKLIYEGDPTSQIVEFVKAENVNLIAMPTHGYGALRRFLIGSETAKILHDVSCPVLTGAHTAEQPASGAVRFSTILCAVHLGPQGQQVLAWASHLAKDLNAKLGLVHAIVPLHIRLEGTLPPDVIAERERVEREKVATLVRQSGAAVDFSEVREGEVAESVCSFAKAMQADLLVIGRGSPDKSGGRLAATAYSIIRQSPCPVISVAY